MIKIVSQGLGSIGRKTIEEILLDKDLELVGAVDINPGYIGKDLGKLLNNTKLGIKINDNAEEVFKKTEPDIVILTTSSSLEKIKDSIFSAVENKVNVLTPAEELFYPWYINKKIAGEIDKLALDNNVSVFSTGVNPGYLMDRYVLKLLKENGIDRVFSLNVKRYDDISDRRQPLWDKLGVGSTKDGFYKLNEQGALGHVGLEISARYLADNLGFIKYRPDFKREPILTEKGIVIRGKKIKKGEVIGIRENCKIVVDEVERINLDLGMYIGAKKNNSFEVLYRGGRKFFDYSNIVNGDIATVRILKDSIIPVVEGANGLNRIDYVPDVKLLV